MRIVGSDTKPIVGPRARCSGRYAPRANNKALFSHPEVKFWGADAMESKVAISRIIVDLNERHMLAVDAEMGLEDEF